MACSSTTTHTKPKCRRFQYRLKTLGWLFVGLGLVFAVVAAVYDRVRWQRDAVRAVRQSGGEVYDDAFEERDRLTCPGAFGKRSGPGWLGKLLGNDAVSSVNGVVYAPAAASPKLAAIPRLRGLKWVWMVGAKVVDSDVEGLEGTADLEVLNLAATEITDQALPALARLPSLRRLSLAFTQVSDEGLVELERLDRLEELQLIETRVTATGVERLHRALPGLAIRWSRAPTEEERCAAAAITRLGGWFLSQDDRMNSPLPLTGVGEVDDLHTVSLIQGYHWKGGDADLAQLNRITRLKSVGLHFVTLGSAGIEHLRGLPEVEELDFRHSSFTDGDLIALAEPPGGIPNLKSLSLHNTKVTDAGLAYLKNWEKLETLDLTGLTISENGLRHLKGIVNLRELTLSPRVSQGLSAVTDAMLVEIAGLRTLTKLTLEYTNITDAGLSHLEGLNQLEELRLITAKVTDAGLVHLMGMQSLRNLLLGNTQVTDAGIEKLREALPRCKVN